MVTMYAVLSCFLGSRMGVGIRMCDKSVVLSGGALSGKTKRGCMLHTCVRFVSHLCLPVLGKLHLLSRADVDSHN